MASAAQINDKADLAVIAIGDGDWASALTYLLQAKALLSVKADTKHPSAGELTYDRAALDRLIVDVRRNQHVAAGLQTSNIHYVPTTDRP